MAVELYGATHSLTYATTFMTTPGETFDKVVSFTLVTDFENLCDGIVGINSTCKKQLLINLCEQREFYKVRKVTNAARIPSEHNLVEAMTKKYPFLLYKTF